MTVPRKITTQHTGSKLMYIRKERNQERNYLWVQYINLDREVLNSSLCE